MENLATIITKIEEGEAWVPVPPLTLCALIKVDVLNQYMLPRTIVGGTAPTLVSTTPESVGPGFVWSCLIGGTQFAPPSVILGDSSPGPPTLPTIDDQKGKKGLPPGTVLGVQGLHDWWEANQLQGPPREDQARRTAGVSNVKCGRKVDVTGLAHQGNVKTGLLTNPRPR